MNNHCQFTCLKEEKRAIPSLRDYIQTPGAKL